MSNQIKDKQADNEMWRREVDQKMARLMNLRDTLPQEVMEKINVSFKKRKFFRLYLKIYTINEKITALRQECMKFSQEENFRT